MLAIAEQVGGMGSWEWDLESNQVAYSANALQLYGIAPEEYDGNMESVFGVFHPDDLEMMQQSIKEMLAEKKPRMLEYRIVKPDGTTRIIEGTNQMFFNDRREITHLVGHIQDITERRRGEEALRDSEEQYRLLITNIPDVVWLSDFDGKPVFISPVVDEVFGYSSEEVLEGGRELWYGSIHPDDLVQVQAAHTALAEAEAQFDIEYRVKRKDGKWIWIHDRAIRSYKEEGTGYAYGMFSDITDRKRAEEALGASEQRFREMSDLLPQTIYEADLQGRLTFANEKALESFGYTMKDLDKGLNTLQMLVPEDRERAQQNISAILNGEKAGSNEYTALRKDGSAFPVLIYSSPIYKDKDTIGRRGIIVDITERKLAEQALQESEQRLQDLFDTMSEGVVLISPNGEITQANPGAESILGLTRSEIQERNYVAPQWEILRPDGSPMPPEEMAGPRAMTEKQPVMNVEMGIRRTDGAVAWVNVNAVPQLNDSGEIISVVGTFSDITERKQAEDALRESEERYRAMFEDAAIGISLVNIEGQTIQRNPALYRMLGYTSEEMGELSFRDITHPADIVTEEELFRELVTGKRQTYQLKKRYIRKDQGILWARLTVSLVRSPEGEPLFAIGMVEDTTQRKVAEEALLESEARFRTLFETSPDGVIIDQDGMLVYANPAYQRMLGIKDLQDCLGKPYSPFVAPQDLERVLKISAAREVGKTVLNTYEYNGKRTDGTEFPIEVTAAPLEYDGKPATMAVLRDITDRKRAEEALQESHERLTDIIESISSGFLILDFDLVAIHFNAAAERLLGRKRAEVIGRKLFEAFPEAKGSVFEEKYTQAAREKEPLNFETYFDVEPFKGWYDIHVSPYKTGISVHFQMINERKQIEEALRESEAKYRSLFDHMESGFALHEIVLDEKNNPVDYIFLDVNDAFEKQTGLKKEDIVGKPVTEALPGIEQDETDWIQRYGSVAITGESISFESYAEPLQKWYSVIAYSPGERRFATLFHDITDRKRIEEALRESEEMYRDLVDGASVGMVITEPVTGEILYCNPREVEMLGYKDTAELVAKSATEHLHEDELPRIAEVGKMLERGESMTVPETFRFRKRNGEEIVISAQAIQFPFQGENRILSFHIDITSQKKAEGALQALATTFSAVSGTEFLLQVSQHIAITLGVDYAFIGELIPSEDSVQVVAGLGKGQPIEPFAYDLADTPCANVMGQAICYYPAGIQELFPKDTLLIEMGIEGYIGSPLFNKAGEAIGIIVCLDSKPLTNRDVAESLFAIFAERVSAELERKRAEDELRKIRLGIERSGEVVFMTDLDGVITYVNPTFEQTYGYAYHEAVGENPRILKSGEHPQEAYEQFWKAILAGNIYAGELINKTKDGRLITAEVSVSPILDETDEIIGFLAIQRDITDRKEAEAERERLFAEISESQTRLKALSSKMVQVQEDERKHIARELHDEIGQVMTAVRIDLQRIQKSSLSADLSTQLQRSLDIVEEAQQKARSLSLDLRPAMLDDLGLAATLRWFLDRQSQSLGYQVSFDDSRMTDRPPTEIENVCFRIIQEALTNVARYARASQVEVELAREANQLHITVRDNGSGFDVEQAFENAKLGESLGLLSMQERASLVGGSLAIESEPEKGTTIRAVFPLN
jgi:PAS domain S-box-containing protein